MTAHVPMARVPFASLVDNPRLQHLASAKNRQNGVISQKSSLSAKNGITKSGTSSNKRAHEPSTYDDFDSENIDPAMFDSPSKKTKSNTFDKPAMKPFTFSLSTSTHTSSQPRNSMPPPSSSPTFSSSPRSFATPLRANISAPRAPMTAPAGRSPKRKFATLKSARRTSAPFSRVDPPSFNSTSSTSALPFSLDAALSSSAPTPAPKMAAGATIAESMPKNWFFEIYQDTPEEEAANLMEHSTLTLDLSSDDEDDKKADDYRGKENTPPEGYDAPTASRSSSPTAAAVPVLVVSKKDIVRKKIVKDEMDDGSRSPLSDLETEEFYEEGLTKDSFVVVDEVVEKFVDVKEVFPVATKEKEVDEKEEEVIVACEKDEVAEL